jgi:hypothetical protein
VYHFFVSFSSCLKATGRMLPEVSEAPGLDIFFLLSGPGKSFFYKLALADCTKYFVLPVSLNGFSNRPDIFVMIHATRP